MLYKNGPIYLHNKIVIEILNKIIGPKNIGRLEYFLNDDYKEIYGGPFNGQRIRQEMFLEIIRSLGIISIVETGTFRGSTTLFFAKTNLPVYSVEINPIYYGYSKMRLKKCTNVRLFNDNSIKFIKDILKENLIPSSDIFFYLDAHGHGNNAPLKEEVKLIFDSFSNSVVMIDDFEVPHTSYGFDIREGVAMNLELLREIINKNNLNIFFPFGSPDEETGGKRGMVILSDNDKYYNILEKNKFLIRHEL